MHHWGDGFKYFSDVDEAAFEIGQFLRRYARMSVTQTKEKYGTARVYCHFGWSQMFSITHPGYVWSRYPQWLWKFDVYYISKIIQPLNLVVVPFHRFMYTLAYRLAIKKYPHIREEILGGADYPELLEKL